MDYLVIIYYGMIWIAWMLLIVNDQPSIKSLPWHSQNSLVSLQNNTFDWEKLRKFPFIAMLHCRNFVIVQNLFTDSVIPYCNWPPPKFCIDFDRLQGNEFWASTNIYGLSQQVIDGILVVTYFRMNAVSSIYVIRFLGHQWHSESHNAALLRKKRDIW